MLSVSGAQLQCCQCRQDCVGSRSLTAAARQAPAPPGLGGTPRGCISPSSQRQALKFLTCPSALCPCVGCPGDSHNPARWGGWPWSSEHPQQHWGRVQHHWGGVRHHQAALHQVLEPLQQPLPPLPALPSNGVSSPAGGFTEAAAVGSGTALPPQPGVADPGTLAFLVTLAMTSPLGPCSDRRRGAAISLGLMEEGPGLRRASTAARCSV